MCCTVVCRYRPCDRLIPHLGRLTKCVTGVIASEVISELERTRDPNP